jgi:hypothetical protein
VPEHREHLPGFGGIRANMTAVERVVIRERVGDRIFRKQHPKKVNLNAIKSSSISAVMVRARQTIDFFW